MFRYDKHRDALLKGLSSSESDIEGLDLFQYFSTACYQGYHDDVGGYVLINGNLKVEEFYGSSFFIRFYETYCTVFKTIEEEDKSFYDGDPSEFRYPVFGRSDSSSELWLEFYNFFSVYVTTRSYTWLEKYDVRGENRRIARLAEKGTYQFHTFLH